MTTNLETITTLCGICRQRITIIKGYSNICQTCDSNRQYLARNQHMPQAKRNKLQLRLDALSLIQSNPDLTIAAALRQAIKNARSQR